MKSSLLPSEPLADMTIENERLTETFSALVTEFAFTLEQLGFIPGAPSKGVFAKFTELPLGRKSQILNDIATSNIITSELLPSERIINRERELLFFKRFMKHMKFRLAQDYFLEGFTEGDILEVYDLSGIQIYRSWGLFKVISYSLADLLVYPFDVLYERPSWVLAQIYKCAERVLSPGYPRVSYKDDFGIPSYVMTERFEGHHNSLTLDMKHLGLILDEAGQPAAMICTSKGELLAHRKSDINLAYL